jgi:hypothetical protein
MYVPPTLRFYGVGGFILFAEITAAAIPLWGCCSFFISLFRTGYPHGCSGLETADCPLAVSNDFRKPVFESPSASGSKLDFIALTGRYHPARH